MSPSEVHDVLTALEHRVSKIEDKVDQILGHVLFLRTNEEGLAKDREQIQSAIMGSPMKGIFDEINKQQAS